MANSDAVLRIVAEEVGVSRDELTGDTEFAELGVDGFLAQSIISRVLEELKIKLPAHTFDANSTVDSLQARVAEYAPPPAPRSNGQSASPITASSTTASPQPLSIIVQGQIASSKKTIFLLPDGSGSEWPISGCQRSIQTSASSH